MKSPALLFLVASLLQAAASAATPAPQSTPSPQLPRPPVRMIAEWEPAKGAMIRWPLKVPDACVVEMAEDDTVFLLVNEQDEAAARANMEALSIAADHLQIVRCSVASEAAPPAPARLNR